MNFSYLFLTLQCSLAFIILVREAQYRPHILIIQTKNGFWGLPYFPGVRSTAKDLEFFDFHFKDNDLVVEEVKAGQYDYKIVHKKGDMKIEAFPKFKDPYQAANWVPLSAFLRGEIKPPVHDNITIASSSPSVINCILKIFPRQIKHVDPALLIAPGVGVVPNVVVAPPAVGVAPVVGVAPAVGVAPPVVVAPTVDVGPVVVARMSGYGVAEVLVDTAGNEMNIPFVSLKTIIGIFKCSTLQHATATNEIPVCRIDYNMDGQLHDHETVDNINLKWLPVDSVPFMKDVVGPTEMEAFLKRNVLHRFGNIDPTKKHGSQSNIAILRGTTEYYSKVPQLHSSSVLGIKSLERISYKDNFVLPVPWCKTLYSFIVKDTFKAAVDAIEARPGSRVMVVNFANNSTPGGGYLKGSNAQEEDLFRCSNLPWILGQQSKNADLYPINERYTARALFNSDCHIMRDRSNGFSFYPPDKIIQYSVSVCSIAAYNMNSDKFAFQPGSNKFTKLGADVTKQRIHVMFQMAIQKKVDTLILGAFGCGAFGNDPEVICSYFQDIMKVYNNLIPHVQIAVINTGKEKDKKNLEIFKNMKFPQ